MDAQPVSLADLVSPGRWAEFHGLSLSQTYLLIRSGRLRPLNISTGRRATYRLTLDQLPEQPEGLPLERSEAHARGSAS